jgi:hypothetical protein
MPCNQFDCLQQITTTLRDHCPLREYLESTGLYDTIVDGVQPQSPPLPLPGLHHFIDLTTRRIDLDHVSKEDRCALLQPDKLLPPNLIVLELTIARHLRDNLNLHDQDTAMSTLVEIMTVTSSTKLNLFSTEQVWRLKTLSLLLQSLLRLTYLLHQIKDPGVRLTTYNEFGHELFDREQVRALLDDPEVRESESVYRSVEL